jgi:hypothetical protein
VGIVYEICEIGDKLLFLKCGAAYSWSLCILGITNYQMYHEYLFDFVHYTLAILHVMKDIRSTHMERENLAQNEKS